MNLEYALINQPPRRETKPDDGWMTRVSKASHVVSRDRDAERTRLRKIVYVYVFVCVCVCVCVNERQKLVCKTIVGYSV